MALLLVPAIHNESFHRSDCCSSLVHSKLCRFNTSTFPSRNTRKEIRSRPVSALAFRTYQIRENVAYTPSDSTENQFQSALDTLLKHSYVDGPVDPRTFAVILGNCTAQRILAIGPQIHAQIITRGLQENPILRNKLITLYTVCGRIGYAEKVFDEMPGGRNVYLCTAMIQGFIRNRLWAEALRVYSEMMYEECIQPNHITFSCALKACAGLGDLGRGREIHAHLVKADVGFVDSTFNSLMNMYARCGALDMAQQVFERMSVKNLISWSTLITGYAQNEFPNDALATFRAMQEDCPEIDWVVVSAILAVCAQLGDLKLGKEVHCRMVKSDLNPDQAAWNSLIDMYAKCGSMDLACHVFEGMPERNLVSWNTIIAGLGYNGFGERAVQVFYEMQGSEISPDHITLLRVLSACNHSGLVSEARKIFSIMTKTYNIVPRIMHFSTMVDLHGRAGNLEDAIELVRNMPVEPSSSVWGALLSACRVHGNVEFAQLVAAQILKTGVQSIGYYVMLSNIYATARRWDDVEKVRKFMRQKSLLKFPGCSWINLGNKNHVFKSGDKLLKQSYDLYSAIKCIYHLIKETGYVPATEFVLSNVSDDEKELILWGHSEKLAVVFGIINTSAGTPIRVLKNLRICNDCHNAIKLISKTTRRSITVRDINRFHHFEDGGCSCGDYW